MLMLQSLQQTAHDHCHSYPLAKDHVYKSFYVDDCPAGADSPQEALELQNQLRNLLLKGGFDLRKWRSSSSEIMRSIPVELHEPSSLKDLTTENTSYSPKVLGIHWNSTNDVLYVSVGITTTEGNCTKRPVVSDIAKTFDALGWFSPTTIIMKIMMQRLWELKLEWDEEIPNNIQE